MSRKKLFTFPICRGGEGGGKVSTSKLLVCVLRILPEGAMMIGLIVIIHVRSTEHKFYIFPTYFFSQNSWHHEIIKDFQTLYNWKIPLKIGSECQCVPTYCCITFSKSIDVRVKITSVLSFYRICINNLSPNQKLREQKAYILIRSLWAFLSKKKPMFNVTVQNNCEEASDFIFEEIA